MSEKLLPEYDRSHVIRGTATLAQMVETRTFSAGVVYEENLEIAVPPVAGPVFFMAVDDRRRVQYKLDGPKKETQFRKGFSALMPQGADGFWSSLDCSGRIAHVHFAPDAVVSLLGYERKQLRVVEPSCDPFATELTRLLISRLSGGSRELLAIEAVGTTLLAHIHGRYGGGVVPVRGRLAPWQVKRVEAMMRAGLARDVSAHEFASEVHLSPYHFGRAFKATTGLAPHRFLIQLRINEARALLSDTEKPISEVAAAVGYGDPSYFARLFRREIGVTPLRYRQELRS